jgi:hypothetical protein
MSVDVFDSGAFSHCHTRFFRCLDLLFGECSFKTTKVTLRRRDARPTKVLVVRRSILDDLLKVAMDDVFLLIMVDYPSIVVLYPVYVIFFPPSYIEA